MLFFRYLLVLSWEGTFSSKPVGFIAYSSKKRDDMNIVARHDSLFASRFRRSLWTVRLKLTPSLCLFPNPWVHFRDSSVTSIPTDRSASFCSSTRTNRGAPEQFRAGFGTEWCQGHERLVHWTVRSKMSFDDREDTLDCIVLERTCSDE
jgi:hypothetical protein